MQWPEKYRPTSFAAVRGQEDAVTILSRLSFTRSWKYPLLLSGAVGSGKTTLVRLHAKALNCGRVDDDGSPCMSCTNCLAPISVYLKEYNAPLVSAEPGKVHSIVKEEIRTPSTRDIKVKVVFFDEAQGLNRIDQELMLKVLEELPDRVAVCFATTEENKLLPALRSRLFKINIGPIRQDVAIELLQFVAAAEDVEYELPAFYLMVAALPAQARDLVKALQELCSFGQKIDVPLVKAICRLSVYDKLTAYVLALAARDRDAQTQAIIDWDDSWTKKVLWIQRFLTTVYYNDVVGQRIVIDPLCYAMDLTRWQFIRGLCARFGVDEPSALAEVVEKWLAFWSQPGAPGEDALALRFSLFEALANGEVSGPATHLSNCAIPALAVNHPKQARRQPPWERLDAPIGSLFIEREEIREIIHRASFLMQEHGVAFNMAYQIEPPPDENRPDEVQSQSILDCCQRLCMALPFECERFAAALLIERNGAAIVGRLAAWIPNLNGGSEVACQLKRWGDSPRQAGFDIQGRFTTSENDHRFHWQAALDLCAGFDADELAVPPNQTLRRLLQISNRRQPGPFAGPRLFFGGRLTSGAMQAGCENAMIPPSALDASVWPEVISGWELKEHSDRMVEAKRRSDAIAHLEAKHRDDHAGAAAAIEGLRNCWASLPTGSWPRTWRKRW